MTIDACFCVMVTPYAVTDPSAVARSMAAHIKPNIPMPMIAEGEVTMVKQNRIVNTPI